MAGKETGATVLEYLKWRGDLTLMQSPFNEVDNLILCILSYLDYHRFPMLMTKSPAEAIPVGTINGQMTEVDEQLGLSEMSYLPVMRMVAASRRFGDMKLLGYEHVFDGGRETQFQAISFLLSDGSLFIAYMGTDRSIAGWKEDFNMSFLAAVPAQKMAEVYARQMAEACPDQVLRLGGHSKGGNLAVWAGIHMPEDVQKRIDTIYNNDGPGFGKSPEDAEGFCRVRPKIRTFVPESSIVGVLLDHAEDYTVIESVNRAVLQHEALSWCCEGPQFVHLGSRSETGRMYDGVLQEWIGSMTTEERQEFSEALFMVLSGDGKYSTIDDLKRDGVNGGRELLMSFAKADEKKKKIIMEIFRRLAADIGAELKKKTENGLESAKNTIVAAGKTLIRK